MIPFTSWLLLLGATILAVIVRIFPRLRSLIKCLRGTEQGTFTVENLESKEVNKRINILNGPKGWPLIGSLHLLRGSDGPFAAFTRLAQTYGDIYEIQLGTFTCVVVSSYSLVKEVLITKGSHFGGRPNFLRFHKLFGGDRNNSLALCDWSDLQRQRRSLARSFCNPRGGSPQQEELSRVATLEIEQLIKKLNQEEYSSVLNGEKSFKPCLLLSIANMFTRYMCSCHFDYADEEFRNIVRLFDEIFWEINQGYAVDFLPWLKPFYSKHMQRLFDWGAEIRSFILRTIINDHRKNLDPENGMAKDFTDALLFHLENKESDLSWEHILYELEDFLGGHSAIGNLIMLILAHLVIRPDIQRKVQAECDAILNKPGRKQRMITLNDRENIPYTEAVIWETLRVSSSPIVPRTATKDTEIEGYLVKKDTLVFINNWELNLEEKYWGPDSREFKPERFLKTISIGDDRAGTKLKISKPDIFVPFSTGKRACIGQKLVQGFSLVVVAALFAYFDISAASDDVENYLTPGCLAVPPEPFHLVLKPRKVLTTEM